MLFCFGHLTWEQIRRCAADTQALYIFGEEGKIPAGELEGIWGAQT